MSSQNTKLTLTKDNINILKSLTSINPQMYFQKDTLGIASNDKEIIAYYDYGIDLANDFGIYDVNSLLSILSLYKTPVIDVGTSKLEITEGKSKNEYRFTQKNCITVPPSKTVMLEDQEDGTPAKIEKPTSTFSFTKAEFENLQKQISILKVPNVVFEDTHVLATDVDNSSCNTYAIDVTPDNDIEKVSLSSEKISMIEPDDYTVELNDKTVTFKGVNNPLTYVIVAQA